MVSQLKMFMLVGPRNLTAGCKGLGKLAFYFQVPSHSESSSESLESSKLRNRVLHCFLPVSSFNIKKHFFFPL